VQQAQAVAEQNQSQVIFPLHLLIALAEEKEGIVRPVLPVQRAARCHRAEGRRLLGNLPKTAGMQPGTYLSQPLNEVLERAFDEAGRFKDEFVSTEHMLLSIAQQRGDPAAQLLDRAGATHDAILKALVSVRGSQRVTDQNPESKYQALERYAHDLTESARQGKLDPVIGRDDEIRRVMQVLSRRTKNNPVLIGEPGVGKTAIVEGLAQRMSAATSPTSSRTRSWWPSTWLDDRRHQVPRRIRRPVEGRGQGNRRFQWRDHLLHRRAAHAGRAGSAEGAIDAANLMKPALRAAICAASAPPRSTSTRSTWRRTPPWPAASAP